MLELECVCDDGQSYHNDAIAETGKELQTDQLTDDNDCSSSGENCCRAISYSLARGYLHLTDPRPKEFFRRYWTRAQKLSIPRVVLSTYPSNLTPERSVMWERVKCKELGRLFESLKTSLFVTHSPVASVPRLYGRNARHNEAHSRCVQVNM